MGTEDDKLERSRRPGKLAKELHGFCQGKIEVSLKTPVRSFFDFAICYTPGVATPCREIAADQSKVWTNTNSGNTIAVVSDGSRVSGIYTKRGNLFFDKQIWDDFAFYTSAKLRNRIARRVELPLKLP